MTDLERLACEQAAREKAFNWGLIGFIIGAAYLTLLLWPLI